MSATQIYSDLFNSDGTPKHLKIPSSGSFIEVGVKTVPTTSIDEQYDTTNMVPIRHGREIDGIHVEAGDFDNGGTAADFDIVLRDPDAALTAAPLATLWNSGAAFQAAVSKYIPINKQLVPMTAKGYCIVAMLVNTAAGTPAQQDLTLTVFAT